MEAIEGLRRYLTSVPPGAMSLEQASEIEGLLSRCWYSLIGSDSGGMKDFKLSGRTESMRWEPPHIVFTLERHGRTVKGSVYAELQTWTVNVATAEAAASRGGRRLVGRREPRLNVNYLAKEIASLIASGAQDDRLKWLSTDRVQLKMEAIVPTTNRQTTGGRRRRFSKALDAALTPKGWTRKSSRHDFQRTDPA
jgi:hypothetical protein